MKEFPFRTRNFAFFHEHKTRVLLFLWTFTLFLLAFDESSHDGWRHKAYTFPSYKAKLRCFICAQNIFLTFQFRCNKMLLYVASLPRFSSTLFSWTFDISLALFTFLDCACERNSPSFCAWENMCKTAEGRHSYK